MVRGSGVGKVEENSMICVELVVCGIEDVKMLILELVCLDLIFSFFI